MKLGDINLRLVDDGIFRLDGGAMFGIVPKPVWERTNPGDEANRIRLRACGLLIESEAGNILVDAGLGTKLNGNLNKIYAFEGSMLLRSLADAKLGPEDIRTVVFTHLHLDHCGGATHFDEAGRAVPTFPRAEHIVQRKEWEAANNPNERTAGSYRKDDFVPLEEAGLLRLVDGTEEIAPGVTVELTGGHTPGHQIVRIESGGKTAVFLGDLIATTGHVRLPYVMGYDLFPLEVMEKKRRLLDVALRENWLLVWEHDPEIEMGYLVKDGEKVRVRRLDHMSAGSR